LIGAGIVALALLAAAAWRPLTAWWFDDLGNLALAEGDAAGAQSWFDRGLALTPHSRLLLEDRGRALLDSDPAEALRDFQASACGAACIAEMGDAQARLGNADAAVVYASQAQALGRRVRTVPIPESAQPVISDTAAVLTAAPHPAVAAAFLRYLTGPNGRAYLQRFGFSVP